MTARYFIATQAAYEQARASMDAALGLPEFGTITSIEPAATALRSQDGRLVVAVCEDIVEESAVASMFSSMLAGGTVEELTQAQYLTATGRGGL
jgi:hypothetical protein